jgi:tetratricopeptide (TPR) repeat protein
MEALRKAESTDSNHLDIAYLLGLCYARLARWDEALLYLEQVVTTGSDLMRIYQCRLALAYVYAMTGRYKLAEYEVGRLLQVGFESVQVLSFIAYTSWAQGRVDDAARFYDRALGIDPENANALNGMGYVLACVGKESARALTFCRKAVDKNPENPAYLDSLAWAYHKLGYAQIAQDFLGRALALAPDEAEIRDHARAIFGELGGDPSATPDGDI